MKSKPSLSKKLRRRSCKNQKSVESPINFQFLVEFMITGIREKTIVKEGGKVEISSADLLVGMKVEVIVLVEEEQDETEYLLSTESNRRHLEKSIRDAQDPTKLIYIDIESL